MRISRCGRTLCTAVSLLLVACRAADADHKDDAGATKPEHAATHPAGQTALGKYLGDTVLVNQDGRPMHFYSDLLQGRSAVINAFFTTCTGSCPVMAGTFAKIQDRLGDRLGKDVVLISVSVDSENDTPEKLKEFGNRFKAKPGWYFLTGEKTNVDHVLQKIGQQVKAPNDHSAIFIIGNDRTGLWKKAFGLAAAEDVIKVVMGVVDDRGENPPGAGSAAMGP